MATPPVRPALRANLPGVPVPKGLAVPRETTRLRVERLAVQLSGSNTFRESEHVRLHRRFALDEGWDDETLRHRRLGLIRATAHPRATSSTSGGVLRGATPPASPPT